MLADREKNIFMLLEHPKRNFMTTYGHYLRILIKNPSNKIEFAKMTDINMHPVD